MTKLLKYLLSALAGLVFSISVPAQNTQTRLQDDRAVKKGTLGSGITYYIVENPVMKGRADAALVRRGETVSARSGEDLAPFSGFLFRSGISPSPEGFIHRRGNSTVFSFPSVAVHETALLDSTLLMIFTLAGKSAADEAIIISGDVNAQALKAKLDIFSLMLPRRSVGVRQDTHAWNTKPPQWNFRENTGGNRARIKVSYCAPRLPQNRLYTSQALVPELFAAQFEPFVRRRIDRSFSDAGIPYSDLEFTYRGTGASPGDEVYSLSMVTDTLHCRPAMERLALVLGAIDDFGASTEEFTGIRASMKPGLIERSGASVPDEAYVERCISHFLYGTNMAPESTLVNLAVKRQLADSTWSGLFNNYNRAWLGRLENLNLEIESGQDSLDTDELIFAYNLNYLIGSTAGDTLSRHWASADSLLKEKDFPKVRLREIRKEAVSGGETLHYSNGVKLVYRNVPSAEGFNFAVVWQGGMDNVEDIRPGEGAYIGEMFRMFDAAGMNCVDLREALAAAGISMEASLVPKNLVVKGHAPSDGLQLLLSYLVSITTEGKLNKDAFEAMRRNVSVGEDGYMSRIVSAMMPGYQNVPVPLKKSLSEDTFRKAAEFYSARFSRMNEATIIVIGNVDEQTLKKLMVRYAGGFKTFNGVTSKRGQRYNMQDLHITGNGEGAAGLHSMYHADLPLSANTYFGAMVMEEWLSRALPQALSRHGLSVRVSTMMQPWPEERLIVEIHCAPMSGESLPAGVEAAGSAEWAALLDRTLRNLEEPSSSAITIYKERVSKRVKESMESSGGLVEMVLLRLAFGKNFTVNWADNVSSVDAARLHSMWTALLGGGNVKVICPERTSTEQ